MAECIRAWPSYAVAAVIGLPACLGAQAGPPSSARGLSTVSVVVFSSEGELTGNGGFSAASTTSALELEFRKAGVRVVPYESRGDNGALLMISVTCRAGFPACAASSDLSRFSYFGPTRQRIGGQIWTSGPVVFTSSDWITAARQIREWSIEQAIDAANRIRSANES